MAEDLIVEVDCWLAEKGLLLGEKEGFLMGIKTGLNLAEFMIKVQNIDQTPADFYRFIKRNRYERLDAEGLRVSASGPCDCLLSHELFEGDEYLGTAYQPCYMEGMIASLGTLFPVWITYLNAAGLKAARRYLDAYLKRVRQYIADLPYIS